jgi:autotransporter-associated beta strand protein
MPPLSRALALAAVLAVAGPAAAQTTYTWTGTGSGGSSTAWLTTTNWTGGVAGTWPGVGATASASNGNAGDVAAFNLTASPSGALGINMNTAGGTFTLGAISMSGTTQSLSIGNSSTTFAQSTTLQLNNSGAVAVGGFTNVILSNASTSGTLTLQHFQAITTPRMNLLLGNTNNVIVITNAAAGITINNDIFEANAGSGFTLQGAGNLTLGATGSSYSGPVTAAGNGRFTVLNAGVFGTGPVAFNNTDDKSTANFNMTFNVGAGSPRAFANAVSLSSVGNAGFAAATGVGGQAITFSGVLSGGAAGLTTAFTNTGTVANGFFVLTNPANNFTSTVLVGTSGLAVTSDAALGNAANALTLNTNDATRGGLRFDADNITLAASRAVTVTNPTVVNTNGFTAGIAGTVANTAGKALVKAGAGTLTLSGSNNTLDTVTINQGTLALSFAANNDNKLATGAAVTLAGGTLRMVAQADGSTQTLGPVTVNPGGSSTIAAVSNGGTGAALTLGTITRNAGGAIDFTLPAVGGVTTATAAGAAGLLLDGGATVGRTDWATVTGGTVAPFTGYAVKSDASTFAAADHVTNVGAYMGTVGSSLTIASLRFNDSSPGVVTIDPAATLTINAGSAGGILVTPAVAGNQQITGGTLTAGTELLIHQYGTGDLRIDSAITGSGGLTKAGPGRLVLGGANTFTGPVRINGGTLSVTSVTTNTNLGTDPTSATANVLLGGTLQYTGTGAQTLAANRQVSLTGVYGPAGAAIDVTQSTAALTVAGVVSGPQASSLTKRGPGTLVLSATNTFLGDLIVSNGTVQSGNASGFAGGSAAAVSGRVVLGDADTGANPVSLLLTAGVTVFNPIYVPNAGGTGAVTVGVAPTASVAPVFSSPFILERSVTLQAGTTGRISINNKITGTGDVVIAGSGGAIGFDRATGTAPTADFVGNVILNPGAILSLGTAGSAANVDKSIPNTADVMFNTGSVLRFDTGTSLGYESVNALVSVNPGDGTINANTASTNFRLTVGTGNNSGTFSGVISNTGTSTSVQLIKAGTGSQTLRGASTYTGGTVVYGGTLAADTPGPGSATGTGTVTINTGGTLRGVGNVTGAITLNAGGTLAPGDAAGVGTLTTAAQPVFAGGTFRVNLSSPGASGQLAVTAAGNLSLGAGNPVTLIATPYTGPTDGAFTIIQTASGAAVTGTFANYPLDQMAVFTNPGTGTEYDIFYGSYPGQPGNVVIAPAPVPEPGHVIGLCAAAVAVAGRLRPRRPVV